MTYSGLGVKSFPVSNAGDEKMRYAQLCLGIVGWLLLGQLPAGAQSCESNEVWWAVPGNWTEFCKQNGDWKENNWEECDSQAQWDEAKRNINWVLLEDEGALATYKAAIEVVNLCDNSAGGMGEQIVSLHAILYAQHHNPAAQCSIARCERNYVASTGYYDRLKEEGKLPE